MKKKLLKLMWNTSKCLMIAYLTVYCMSGLALANDTNAQQLNKTMISLKQSEMDLLDLFHLVEDQSEFRFHFNSSQLENSAVSKLKSTDLETLLYEIARQTGLSFKQVNESIGVKFSVKKSEPVVEVKVKAFGKVLDIETNEPVFGANIYIPSTAQGVVADLDGNWAIEVDENLIGEEVKISSLGYFTMTEVIRSGEMIIYLKPQELEEVVVVGYGTQKKLNLTGAVDQVGGEVFENRPVANIAQGLQGAIPNLNLVVQDGKPTQSPTFNIRGATSIGQGGNALVLIDGVEGDPSLINPSDIENVSVLKDAAAASIYGARGAFGVVLITTKSPKRDQFTVSYNANFSVKQPTTVPDLVSDGYTWASMFNEAWSAWNDYSQTPQNVNKTLPFSQEYLAELKRRSEDPSLPKVEVGPNGEYIYYENTDYYGELYKNSTYSQEHNISMSGGSEKLGFYITGRLFDQPGLFKYNSDDFKQYNFRAKGNMELASWLTVENNTDFSSRSYHNPLNVGEGGSIWRNIADEGHPMAPLTNPDGTYSYSAAYTIGDMMYGKNGIDSERRLLKNYTGLTATLFEERVKVRGNLTFQTIDDNATQIRVPVPYSRSEGVIEYVGLNTNDIQQKYGETNYLATNFYAEYEPRLGEDHFLKALAGYNYEQSTYNQLIAQRNGLIYEDAQDINLALGQSIITQGGYEKWNIMGGFVRLNYDYKGKYLAEVNARYDGSSKFPEDERYAVFPSFSLGWRVSDEDFFAFAKPAITDFKIRGSYGSLGNGSINSYAFQQTFNIGQSSRIINGILPQQTSQPGVLPDGLTWETSTTANLGLDLGMFENKLTFTGDVYVRKTTDMFTVGTTLPAVFGTAVPKGNYADLETKGWEFVLAYQDQASLGSKPFNYQVKFFMADNTSKITKYNNPDKRLSDYYEGMTIGEMWGFETLGLFQSAEEILNHADQSYIQSSRSYTLLPGDIKFRDVNGDGVVDIGTNTVEDSGDLRVIGNSAPRYTYGFNVNLDWNNFFFTAFAQGVMKQDWWPGAEASLFWGQYNRPYNDIPTSMLGNIYSEDNPDAYFPRYRGYTSQGSNKQLTAVQTRYIQNIGYIRLKNIQIGYNLPQQMTQRLKMSSARVYFSGENLWSWSPLYNVSRDLDVESTGPSDRVLTSGTSGNGNNYPILKSFTFGVAVSF